MMIFAFLHLFAFPYTPYSKGAAPAKFPISSPSINSGMDGPGPNLGGFLGIKAFIDAMNPWDLVKAFARGMKWLFVGRKNRENDSSYKNSAFNFGNGAEGVTLGDASGPNGAYKSDTGYNGAASLPIADQFRRSNFGMPATTVQDEEGAGLIAHAQPNPLNRADSNYAQHPGQLYDYNGQQTKPAYPGSSNQRYDPSGQDIGAGKVRYGPGTEYSSSYGRVPGSRDESPYKQDPGAAYRAENQSADIGMAIGGESEPHQSQAPSSQAYRDARRQQRPSDQWKNSSRSTTPPSGEDELLFSGARPGPPGGNVI